MLVDLLVYRIRLSIIEFQRQNDLVIEEQLKRVRNGLEVQMCVQTVYDIQHQRLLPVRILSINDLRANALFLKTLVTRALYILGKQSQRTYAYSYYHFVLVN